MSKANRWATQTTKFQEAQRIKAQLKKDGLTELEQQRTAVKAAMKAKTIAAAAQSGGSVVPNSTIPTFIRHTSATSTSSAWVPLSTGATTSISGTWFTGGTIKIGTPLTGGVSIPVTYQWDEVKVEPEVVKNPSDDTTRQMVERAVLAAIDRCLAADHYPQGVAMTQAALDALKGSPLVSNGYWDGEVSFLSLKIHVVDMIDPLDVEVGW